jgi:hypothetical protein
MTVLGDSHVHRIPSARASTVFSILQPIPPRGIMVT